MQSGSLFLLRILSGSILLALVSSLSWAAPLLQTDQPGLCCVNNTLKENTEKQCEKIRGIYYPAKKKATAEKVELVTAPEELLFCAILLNPRGTDGASSFLY